MEGRGDRWRIATIVAVVVALVAVAVVWVVADRRNDRLAERLAALESDAASSRADDGGEPSATPSPSPSPSSSPSTPSPDDLASTLEEMLGAGGLGDLDGLLEDLLGGSGQGGLGAADPRLQQCLGGGGAAGLPGLGGGAVPDGSVQEQVAAIAELVAEDRGMRSDEPLDVELTSRSDLAARARALTDEDIDADEADVQSRLLAALAVVDEGTDAEQLLLDALDAAVGGYYDPETEELVIGAEEIDALGALVVAHEVQHAVADDVLGLPDLERIAESRGSDAAAGALSVVEGDASLVSQRFSLQHMSLEDVLAITVESLSAQRDLAGIPHLISRELQFPYVEGLSFTCGLYLDGGWDAVDAAYRRPPATTAQVLFPDRYGDREGPIDVRDVTAPAGWTVLDRDTFGAASLLFLLEAPGDDPAAGFADASDRVASWGGGEVTVLARGQDTAVAVGLVDRFGTDALCGTVVDLARASYDGSVTSRGGGVRVDEGDRVVDVRCDGGRVWMFVAPDVDVLADLAP